SGYINGLHRRNWPDAAGGEYRNFYIGDASSYTPVDVYIQTGTGTGGQGGLTVSTTAGDHPNIGDSDLLGPQVNRYYSVTANNLTSTDYSAIFNWVGADEDGPFDVANAAVGKYSGGTWTYPQVGGGSGTSIGIYYESAFSDFQVA